MRKFAYSLIWLVNLVLVGNRLCGQPNTQNLQPALEALISYHDRMTLPQQSFPVDPAPVITFHAYINHKTTLKELAKIKRKVSRRLGIQLSFQNLKFNTMGLASILVDARSADTIYQTIVSGNLMCCSDFGIFEMACGTKRQCFIGSRASLLDRLHLLIAKKF